MMYKEWVCSEKDEGLSDETIIQAVKTACSACSGNILLVPPDQSRFHSGCGHLTNCLYHLLVEDGRHVDIMPALGTHDVMSFAMIDAFLGSDIPKERILPHNWRRDTTELGKIPETFLYEISEGVMKESVPVEINRALLQYDCVLSLGQVVPHEVVGMSGYTKNIIVGVGGSKMIGVSHLLGALYGLERMLGHVDTPVRKLFDYAQEHFLNSLPILHILTVATSQNNNTQLNGLFFGNCRKVFEQAANLSQKKNITYLERPIKKCVVYLDPFEFHSLWIGNKAIYRTRIAMADGGELLILAKGIKKFGEDPDNDCLLRKYGYPGREAVIRLLSESDELQSNPSAASTMIYGSTEGRFHVTYCTDESLRDDILRAGYGYGNYENEIIKYRNCVPGWNQTQEGEEIYYINNPAIGLWTLPFIDN